MRLRRWLPRAIVVSGLLAALLSAPGLARVESAPSDPRITIGAGRVVVRTAGGLRRYRFSEDARSAALIARLTRPDAVLDASAAPVQAAVEDFLVFSGRLQARESDRIVPATPPLDLDADGRTELFITPKTSGFIEPSELWEYDGGTALFSLARAYLPEELPGFPATLGDVDGDGVRDLLTFDASHQSPFFALVRVLKQAAPGSFDLTEIKVFTTKDECCIPASADVADLDGDHRPEVMFSDQYPANLTIDERDDRGEYREVFTKRFRRNYLLQQVLVTDDLDDDGRREVLVGGQPDPYRPGRLTGLFLYEASGDDRYRLVWNDGPALRNFDALANAGDTDGDGRKEFLAASTNGDLGALGEQCTLYEYDGAGGFRITWEASDTVASIFDGVVVASYDFDGDGRPEILCYHRRGLDYAVDIYRSTGNDAYELLTSLSLGTMRPYHPSKSFAIGDFDRDQRPDLIVNRTDGDRLVTDVFHTAESYPTPPPAANLGAVPRAGRAPLTVKFSDLSDGAVATRRWDFGDGGSSAEAAPTHVYERPGVYAVRLDITGPGGSAAKTREAYITVRRP